jgi:signal transduction histidine kinase
MAGIAVCTFVLLFTVLSFGILSLQQRIVNVTNETTYMMVPKLLEQLRTVRNLEMLRHYGSLAAKATDKVVRQDAAYLAALATLSPVNANDTPTQLVVDEGYLLIRSIAARESDPALWPAMEDRLTQRADEIAINIGNMTLKRATDIRDDSLKVRNIALVLAVLFAASMLVMLLLGRAVLAVNRTKNQFFNEANHDFKQRLHSMQLLINDAKRNPQPQNMLVLLVPVIADLQRYLDNFLEIARLEAGTKKPLFKTNVLLQSVFQQLEVAFYAVAKNNNIDLKFRNTSLSCNTNEHLLLRILENLVSNALKFARNRVLIVARQRRGFLEVLVIDNGPGMPARYEENPYKAFIQGGTNLDQGYGLGLSIVKRLSDQISVALRIRSHAGRGTTVQLKFTNRNG